MQVCVASIPRAEGNMSMRRRSSLDGLQCDHCACARCPRLGLFAAGPGGPCRVHLTTLMNRHAPSPAPKMGVPQCKASSSEPRQQWSGYMTTQHPQCTEQVAIPARNPLGEQTICPRWRCHLQSSPNRAPLALLLGTPHWILSCLSILSKNHTLLPQW